MLNIDYKNCTGCALCSIICPSKAISMCENFEGFLYPKVEESKCINCNKCTNLCPINKMHFHEKPLDVFAVNNISDKERKESSSGAVFPIISKYIFSKNGVVFGATLDKDFVVKHIYIDNINDIYRLKRSKYVQSYIGDAYVKCKNFLDEGRYVLFSGTPCQISALNNFLNKDYDKLYTLEVLCRGAMSPGLFKLYIKFLLEHYKFDKIEFRNKNSGWRDWHFTLSLGDKIVFDEQIYKNIFMKTFVGHHSYRTSCFNCKFSRYERCADFTIGDYWSISDYKKSLDDNKGTSFLLLNTDKSAQLQNFIKIHSSHFVKLSYAECTSKQGGIHSPARPGRYRDLIFNHMYLNKNIFTFLEKNLFPIAVLNFYNSDNFGALLVGYALVNALRKLGYRSELINYKRNVNSKFNDFRNKYLPQTKPLTKYSDFYGLNEKYKTIIVGSDQVFKLGDMNVFMGAWIKGKMRLISYAASFGSRQYSGKLDITQAKPLLERFDSLSTREQSGLDILRYEFGLYARHVLDPTLLLSLEDWEKLSEENIKYDSDFMFCYYSRVSTYIQEMKDTDVKKFLSTQKIVVGKTGMKLTQWLARIKYSKFNIVTSYHGTIFSIIYRKNFIAIGESKEDDRISSLLSLLGISSRFFYSLDDVTLETFNTAIDYNSVYNKIDAMKKISFDFLRKSLAIDASYKEDMRDNIVL